MRIGLFPSGLAAAIAAFGSAMQMPVRQDRGPASRRGTSQVGREYWSCPPPNQNGHRHPDYKPTAMDAHRILAADERRQRRAQKRLRDYQRCLANNPCLKGAAA